MGAYLGATPAAFPGYGRAYLGANLLWQAGGGGTTPAPSVDRAIPTAGLIDRWRAADITGLTDGAPVASWAPTVGTDTLVQPTVGSQPLWIASGPNGKPTLRWPAASAGNTTYLSASGLPTRTGPFTVCAVVHPEAVNGALQLIHGGTLAIYENFGAWSVNGGVLLSSGAGTALAQWLVLTTTFNGATSTVHLGGTQIASGNAGVGSQTGVINVGRHPTDSSRYWRGDIAEVIYYQGALSATDRAALHSYAQDFYALATSDYIAA